MPAPQGAGLVDPAKIFERDGYACRCCGFVSRKFPRLLTLDGADEAAEFVDPTQCVTTCIFCHRCFHLDQVGARRTGVLIWLPQIGQAALNHICRATYVAQGNATTMRAAGDTALSVLKACEDGARARIHTSDPAVLASCFDQMSDEEYAQRGGKLAGIRLLPARSEPDPQESGKDHWPHVMVEWRTAAFAECMPPVWGTLLSRIAAASA